MQSNTQRTNLMRARRASHCELEDLRREIAARRILLCIEPHSFAQVSIATQAPSIVRQLKPNDTWQTHSKYVYHYPHMLNSSITSLHCCHNRKMHAQLAAYLAARTDFCPWSPGTC